MMIQLRSHKDRFKALICLALSLVLLFAFAEKIWAESSFFVKSTVTMSVNDPDGSAERLIRQAEEVGGYFTHYSDFSIRVLIPHDRLKEYTALIEKQGLVLERLYDTEDQSEALEKCHTRLKTKEEILDKYLDVLKSSKKKNIVSVEMAIVQLTEEIESLKGRIRYMEHQSRYGEINVLFRFKDRSVPPRQSESSFPWLNSITLNDMIRDFNNEL